MIQLFNIPNHQINTGDFNHYLHGDIIEEFESNFRDYVGAKYSCTINSATNAIFLALLNKNTTVNVPSMIPPVVCNAILTSGNKINFVDNTTWIGNSYILHEFEDYKIIDSAQRVDLNQFKNGANDGDLMIFSFYPTKPVGSSDGGIIVSNDEEKIKWFKEATMNGMSYSHNNWDREIKFPGFKMYMNSIQCYIANENLKLLDHKKRKLNRIREFYNAYLEWNNTSDHLYRIEVNDQSKFINQMGGSSITCGVHYNALHENKIYSTNTNICKNSTVESKNTVSIPFHEFLKDSELDYIVDKIKRYE